MKCLELLKVWKVLPFIILSSNLFWGNQEFGGQFEERWQTQKFWFIFAEDSEEEEWALPYEVALPVKVSRPDNRAYVSGGSKLVVQIHLEARSKELGRWTGHSRAPLLIYLSACGRSCRGYLWLEKHAPPPIFPWGLHTGISLLWGRWSCACQIIPSSGKHAGKPETLGLVHPKIQSKPKAELIYPWILMYSPQACVAAICFYQNWVLEFLPFAAGLWRVWNYQESSYCYLSLNPAMSITNSSQGEDSSSAAPRSFQYQFPGLPQGYVCGNGRRDNCALTCAVSLAIWSEGDKLFRGKRLVYWPVLLSVLKLVVTCQTCDRLQINFSYKQESRATNENQSPSVL